MDLDKLKSSWQTADVKPPIDKEKIHRIINQQGQSAIYSLQKTEKTFIVLLIICALISFSLKDTLCIVIYIISDIFAIGWQVYKYNYLKNFKLAQMSTLEVAARISTYKKYLYYEIIIGNIWLIGWFVLLYMTKVVGSNILRQSPDHTQKIVVLLLVFVVIPIFTGIFIWLFYKCLYMSKISTINKAIQEAQEVADFERDERE